MSIFFRMDFTLHGTPTPRTQQRNPASSAVNRPNSARRYQAINPITGEALPSHRGESRAESRASVENNRPDSRVGIDSRPGSRPACVPSLDLSYINAADKKAPLGIEFYEQAVFTPDSAVSNISWGTPVGSARNNASNRFTSKKDVSKYQVGSSKREFRVGVPALNLQEEKPEVKIKVPSAWDKLPISEDLPPPSARQKEVYRQYEEDMKKAYKAHVDPKKNMETEVKKTVEKVKEQYTKDFAEEEEKLEEAHKHLQEHWKQQRNRGAGDLKKMDADEFEKYKKKSHLVETVMIDQLSRSVLSDPEQGQEKHIQPMTPGRPRGSHRFLHDSKVRTTGTSTENLLAKRVRFGARILSSDSHDALRELTGFFFHVDNTLTIYEFRQFGKSAKALPFISRGQYCHPFGVRQGQPYTLVDLFIGAELVFTTSGQSSLPNTARAMKYLTFKVTDVDETEKSNVLLPDVRPSDQQKAYAQLHMPQNMDEYNNQKLLKDIQADVRQQLKKRGIRTVTGLGQYFRKLDQSESGLIMIFDLEKALREYHINLAQQDIDDLLGILDREGSGYVNYKIFMRNVLDEMSELRKHFVLKAFQKIDFSKKGVVSFDEISKFFNASSHPSVKSGEMLESEVLKSFLAAFQKGRQKDITYIEFEEYYEGLSIGTENDQDFVNILKYSWGM